jgi:hypothetical protein
MNRKWFLLLGLALILLLAIYLNDHGRTVNSLEAAYRARDASERCFSKLAEGFSSSGAAAFQRQLRTENSSSGDKCRKMPPAQ